ncbi:hypothetical protein MKX01_009066 [Papaver californicum]|nr:hypothetical protein MKX01_009066 [Papaver californicum]
MVSANKEMAVFCFDTLLAHFNNSEESPVPAFQDGQHPLFVTWKKTVNGGEPRLRGCIGTLEPYALVDGFRDYAMTRDRRFSPIQPEELPGLECTVSVLTDYDAASDYLDWEIGTHGIIIKFLDAKLCVTRRDTYLPEVEEQQGMRFLINLCICSFDLAINSLMRKARYNGVITEKQIQLTRYKSTICTMSYNDYMSYIKTTRGETPSAVGSHT